VKNPDDLQFYVSPSNIFLGLVTSLDDAGYVVVGVPYDRTSSYRTGSRFAPMAVRQASLNIETFSIRSGFDLEDAKIADVGDLNPVATTAELLENVEAVVRHLTRRGKLPILLGGEHTLTLGAIQAFSKDIGVVSFDAHLDLRDEYLQEKVCHASFMRRVAELIGPENIVEVGTRAVSRDEYRYAQEVGIPFFTSQQLNGKNSERYIEAITEKVGRFRRIYVTVDMDVLDPAYAPGVGNPEADGISTTTLLDVVTAVCDSRVTGIDLVEVDPPCDSGDQTAVTAARVLFEAIAAIEIQRRRNP